jgi:hypothetical protein
MAGSVGGPGGAVLERDLFTEEQKQKIDEMGVSAWEFLPDFEVRSNCAST